MAVDKIMTPLESEATALTKRLSAPKVLLVEDEKAHAELISRGFEAGGGQMTLTVVHSLQEAREAMADSPPDVVVTDLNLPDGKGTDLLQGEEDDSVPIVVITGHGDEQKAAAAIKAGALQYVVKSDSTLAEMPRIAMGAIREWSGLVDKKRAEAALRSSEQRYRSLYDESPSMCFTVDRHGTVLTVNHFASEQLGFGVGEIIGKPLVDLYAMEQAGGLDQLKSCFAEPDHVHRWEVRCRRHGASPIWMRATARVANDVDGEPLALIVCDDITETRHKSERLAYQVSHDPLTGLLNRSEFEQRLEKLHQNAKSTGTVHVLLFLDLDRFKTINDNCGHQAGDELLRQLAGLLGSKVRQRDTLARIGGDEFGVLVEHCQVKDALRVAHTLRQLVEEFRFVWIDKSFSIGVSIGLVPITETSESGAELLAAADAACYAAKDRGRNWIHVYHEDIAETEKKDRERPWSSRIQNALEDDRFRLYYQPIAPLDGSSDRGECYELLVRMLDQRHHPVLPGAFLPAAERYSLSVQVDQWVVSTALRWLADHRDHLERLDTCSINLSGQSITNPRFAQFIVDELRHTGVSPQKICFEIPETVALVNLSSVTGFTSVLREKGCQFALDDFGSGLSSFSCLRSLAVDYIKIDGLFVRDILEDPMHLAIVKSINEIGQLVGKKTVAESVESRAVLERLQEMGFDYAQGYYVGRPQPRQAVQVRATA